MLKLMYIETGSCVLNEMFEFKHHNRWYLLNYLVIGAVLLYIYFVCKTDIYHA